MKIKLKQTAHDSFWTVYGKPFAKRPTWQGLTQPQRVYERVLKELMQIESLSALSEEHVRGGISDHLMVLLPQDVKTKYKLESTAIAVRKDDCETLSQDDAAPQFAADHQQYQMFLDKHGMHLFKVLTPFVDGFAAFYDPSTKE